MCFGNNRTSPKGDRKSREGDGSCHRREDNQAVCGMCAGENLFLEFAPMSSKHLSHSSSLLLTGGGGGLSGCRICATGERCLTVGRVPGHVNSGRVGG
jgi:hypothetical protein